MRHRSQLTIGLLLATLLTLPAHAEVYGGGVVTLPEWNEQAAIDIGQPVTVWRVYIAFDGHYDGPPNKLIAISDGLIDSGSDLYQDPLENTNGTHPIGPALPMYPSLRWDSFVCINTLSTLDGASAGPGNAGINFTNTGVWGEWLISAQDDQGNAQLDEEFGTWMELALVAQITVLQPPPAGAIVDIRRGELGNGGVFTDWIESGVVNPDDPIAWQGFSASPPPPAPGAFDLIAPADGVIITPDQVFEWSLADDAVSYVLEIATDGDFAHSIVHRTGWGHPSEGESTFPKDFYPGELLTPGEQYAWRVRAWGPAGESLSTTSARTFTLTRKSDIDRNFIVDGADLAIVLASWGRCSAPCPADIVPGFHEVNGSDLALLLSEWGIVGP